MSGKEQEISDQWQGPSIEVHQQLQSHSILILGDWGGEETREGFLQVEDLRSECAVLLIQL